MESLALNSAASFLLRKPNIKMQFRYNHKTVHRAGEIKNLQGFQQNTISGFHIRRHWTQVCFVDLQARD